LALIAVSAYPTLASSRLREPLAAATGVALLSLVVGAIGRWAALIQLALSVPVGMYAAFLVDRGEVDASAPLVGAGLLVAAELAYASLEPPTTNRAAARSAALVALAAAGAVALGALLVGAAAFGEGTLAEFAFGVGAAAAAVAVLTWLAWLGRRAASQISAERASSTES
jgi:hypothetical protein